MSRIEHIDNSRGVCNRSAEIEKSLFNSLEKKVDYTLDYRLKLFNNKELKDRKSMLSCIKLKRIYNIDAKLKSLLTNKKNTTLKKFKDTLKLIHRKKYKEESSSIVVKSRLKNLLECKSRYSSIKVKQKRFNEHYEYKHNSVTLYELIRECEVMNGNCKKTMSKVIRLRSQLENRVSNIELSLKNQLGENNPKIDIQRINIKSRRCFIYGKNGKGSFNRATFISNTPS